MDKYLLIITAGGIGKRFGELYPKQLEKVLGQPILEKTIDFFKKITPIHCVVTYPDGFLNEFELALQNIPFKITFVKGGEERFYSVKNAVNFLFNQSYDISTPVLVHDGVRPFLNNNTVRKVIEKTSLKGSAVPFIKISGTMRKITKNTFCETIDREDVVTVTTPQGCNLGILHDCFMKSKKIFTDESTLLEHFNIHPEPVEDWHLNLKITEKKDLETAELLWDRI